MSIPMKAQMEQSGSKGGYILKIDYDENTFRQVTKSESNDTIYHSMEVYKRLNK
jgi:hypothetical protein